MSLLSCQTEPMVLDTALSQSKQPKQMQTQNTQTCTKTWTRQTQTHQPPAEIIYRPNKMAAYWRENSEQKITK